jgi:hypothetical protein
MESLVLQQGDCNGPATYQAVMNYDFGAYIGVFMDIYLDDIIIYSDTIEDHVKHCRIVFDILRKEKLYLNSADKLQFYAEELKILGHVIDRDGIRMDPDKVDSVSKWEVPTNKELLAGFLGAVGFLAPDCANVRIPMGALSHLTGKNAQWRWGPTQQRAFEAIKEIVSKWQSHHRIAIDYSPTAARINILCDASLTGVGGVLTQGDDIHMSRIIAFYSAKFNSAQQNYPVHDRELYAIIQSL